MGARELATWARRLAATATEIRAERGECPPTALVVVNRVPFSLDVLLHTDDDKQALRRLFEVAARGGAEACALVAEGWEFGGNRSGLRRAIRHALEGESLADLRGRRQIVFVHAVSASAEEFRLFDITRRGRLRRASGGRSAAGALSRFLTGLPWAAR